MLGRVGRGFSRLGIVGGKHLTWLPLIGSTQPTLFADFTTEGTTNHYWYNGAQYANFSAWKTASGGTFIQAGTPYYTNPSGLVVPASANVPRFNYDPVALTPKGILLEGASTNQLTHSQLDSGWTTTRGTLTLNAATAPDGTLTAASFIPDTTASSTHFANSPGLTTNQAGTLSAFVKANGYSHAVLTNNPNFYVYFNLRTGAVEGTLGTGWDAAGSIQHPNGVWRLWAHQPASTDMGECFVAAYNAVASSGTSAPSFTADGVSGITVWGADVEYLGFPSSYIPTTTAPVTRAADALTLPLSAASTLTAVDKVTSMEGFVSAGRLLGVGSGKFLNQSDSTHVQTDNGTNTLATAISSWTGANKIGITGTGSSRAIAANGNAAATDANALLSGAITNLYVMSDNAANPSYGDLASIAVWNGLAATGAQLTALTL